MPAKVCPRCGNLYEDLKSKTCPNCFAVLESIDRETAQAMARARADVEQTPEFQAIKTAEDERWREQSFGACLGVVGIFLVTVVFAVVLITVAAHRHSPRVKTPVAAATVVSAPRNSLSPLPTANAAAEEVLPARAGAFDRTSHDQDTLPGTNTAVFHAAYALRGDPLRTADVFAVPADRPAAEQNEFQESIALAARLQKQATPPVPFQTSHWRYVLLGPAADELATALATQFRGG